MLPTCRIHKTELVQEEKELNRYENLCASRLKEGVYVEECDYGEIKGQHRGQEDCEDVTHHHHNSATNEYEESTQVTQKSDEPDNGNIMKSHPDDQSQATCTSHQQSVLAQIKLAVDKYKSHQSAPAAKHQMPREGTCDVDEEVYDDIQSQQPTGKGQRAPYHPEAMEDCSENKLDCQNYYNYTAIPQSSAAAGSGTTRYQPLLSRERDYENINLKDYNSINASQQWDDRGSDEEYEYVATKPRYYYQPSVK